MWFNLLKWVTSESSQQLEIMLISHWEDHVGHQMSGCFIKHILDIGNFALHVYDFSSVVVFSPLIFNRIEWTSILASGSSVITRVVLEAIRLDIWLILHVHISKTYAIAIHLDLRSKMVAPPGTCILENHHWTITSVFKTVENSLSNSCGRHGTRPMARIIFWIQIVVHPILLETSRTVACSSTSLSMLPGLLPKLIFSASRIWTHHFLLVLCHPWICVQVRKALILAAALTRYSSAYSGIIGIENHIGFLRHGVCRLQVK